MKKLSIAFAALWAAGTAFAGEIMVPVEPEVMSSDSDATGALVLLALVAIVVAAGSGMMATKRESDPYLLPTEDDNS